MPEIGNPFKEEEEDSPGEIAHRLAEYVRTLVFNADVTLTEAEVAAVSKVIGAVLRAHPWIKGWIKQQVPGIIE